MIKKISRRNLESKKLTSTTIFDEGFRLDQCLFLDLEHYIFKVPVCIGIFGCSRIEGDELVTNQYFLENNSDLKVLVESSIRYFETAIEEGYKYLVTFAGKNDMTVLKSMYKKFNLDFDFSKNFKNIDIQKEIEKKFSCAIGLKDLEKIMGIHRESESISGSTIAKTFQSIMKDPDYINRIPQEKIERLLVYNRCDSDNLFYILKDFNSIEKESLDEFITLRNQARDKEKLNLESLE